MNIEYHEFYSHNLDRVMAFKSYGHRGKPIIVFPSSGGRFYEYEDFKMIEACSEYINQGVVRFYTVDSIDGESWLNKGAWPGDMARAHNAFDRYIMDEVVPFIREHNNWYGSMGTTGCSMGGYHSVNFFFKHPHVFDTLIALSGIYDVRFFLGDNVSDIDVYLNSPVDYLRNLNNEDYLNAYRNSNIIICTGKGLWEEDTIRDTKLMEDILKEKNVPAWIDYWGSDVDHDWPWWRVQMPYFLRILMEHGKLG